MMNRLRGRNLAHPGCLIGVTLGLTLGIILAAVLAVVNVPLNTVLLVWLSLTVGLAALGWVIGSALSSRFPALKEKSSDADSHTPAG
jgi:ABC-type lipoprotein release transport system permease subunit